MISKSKLTPIKIDLQVPGLWEDDLQSVVQMGFGQNQQQSFHGKEINNQFH